LPLFGPLSEAALRLLGFTPRSLAKRAGSAWQPVARGLGSLRFIEVDPEGNSVQLVLENVPHPVSVPGPVGEGLAGCFEGFFTTRNTNGQVIVVSAEDDRQGSQFEISWE
jgi:hypothetical protein